MTCKFLIIMTLKFYTFSSLYNACVCVCMHVIRLEMDKNLYILQFINWPLIMFVSKVKIWQTETAQL